MSHLSSYIASLLSTNNLSRYVGHPIVVNQVRNYAARKGTRERKRVKKVKVEEKKVGFIPHNERKKESLLLMRKTRKFDDSWKQVPKDNVYPHKYYRWPTYSFIDGVQCHKETHHPDMYNRPNEYLRVTIELNMEGEKKTRFVDSFTRIVGIAHRFDVEEERNIIAFTKIPEMQEDARRVGAQLVGGVELIKEVQNGAVSLQDFQHVVAHPNILPELVVLRGLLKRKYPNIKMGTLDVNVPEICERLLYGINYTAMRDEYEKDFGIIETIIGKLDMESTCLEENFASLVRDIYKVKPKRKGPFITRCLLWSPPSQEKLRVDHNVYLAGEEETTVQDVEEDTAEQVVAQ